MAADDSGIVTDRPDFVESSQVVGAGRFQVETSVLVERGRQDDGHTRTYSMPTLLRYGVGDTLELRIETDGRTVDRKTGMAGANDATSAGYADTALGLKWHVADDTGRMPSVALLLHADLPSGSGDFRGEGVRPSLRVAAEWELPAGLALGVMPGVGVERNASGSTYHYGVFGIVLGREISSTVRGFVEVAAPQIARPRDGGTVARFDTGTAWLLSAQCQLDAMLSFGLNRRTPDLALTAGLSFQL
jgi:hypothetical protein